MFVIFEHEFIINLKYKESLSEKGAAEEMALHCGTSNSLHLAILPCRLSVWLRGSLQPVYLWLLCQAIRKPLEVTMVWEESEAFF